MENFDNIPSKSLKVEVTHLVNTLASNAGLYDSDDVLGALYVLRMKVQKSSQKRVLQLDEDRSLRKEGVTTRKPDKQWIDRDGRYHRYDPALWPDGLDVDRFMDHIQKVVNLRMEAELFLGSYADKLKEESKDALRDAEYMVSELIAADVESCNRIEVEGHPIKSKEGG